MDGGLSLSSFLHGLGDVRSGQLTSALTTTWYIVQVIAALGVLVAEWQNACDQRLNLWLAVSTCRVILRLALSSVALKLTTAAWARARQFLLSASGVFFFLPASFTSGGGAAAAGGGAAAAAAATRSGNQNGVEGGEGGRRRRTPRKKPEDNNGEKPGVNAATAPATQPSLLPPLSLATSPPLPPSLLPLRWSWKKPERSWTFSP